ncbi:leucine-rich repeat neuronal protein 1-like [Physella acuta]|uniref:leucine-rich repeat neuronal protein 1-like n=1 Tax=Physella acuta TaxID=109671 RepID=UPI0027DD11DB|nr:leucine-rich repeat neuronal protein 1-like [Physella acuta]
MRHSKMLSLLCQVVSLAAILVLVPAQHTGECDVSATEKELHIFNCSGKNIFQVGEIPEQAEVIDYSDNYISTIPPIEESEKCDHEKCLTDIDQSDYCRLDISFSRNEISFIEGSPFSKLRCLRSLDLSYNRLTEEAITKELFFKDAGYFQLKRLILRGNPIKKLVEDTFSFPFMKYIEEIDLSECSIMNIAANSVDDLRSLKVLDLSKNKLTQLHPATFKGLHNLITLNLRHNQLAQITGHVFVDLVNLNALLLSQNKITSFDGNALVNTSKLVQIDISNNELTSIPYTAIDNLLLLETLDLSNNPITDVSQGSRVSSVKTLILDSLPLTELGDHALASFPHLVTLSISGNVRLKKIHPFVFGNHPSSLREVAMENNAINTLSRDILPWKQLKSLRLSGNPFYCDDALEWMIKATAIQGDTICQEPINLRGQDIKNLKPEELSRVYPTEAVEALILVCVCTPLIFVCAILIWKRRRHCACLSVKVRGRYVSVYTRDVNDEGEQRVTIELKANFKKLSAVSNGEPDDSKPFIKIDNGKPDEEEEI